MPATATARTATADAEIARLDIPDAWLAGYTDCRAGRNRRVYPGNYNWPHYADGWEAAVIERNGGPA